MARDIMLLLVGFPGNMISAIATATYKNPNYFVPPFGIKGPEIDDNYFVLKKYVHNVSDKILIFTINDKEIKDYILEYTIPGRQIIAVDYTTADAVMGNVDFYCKNQISFVMGTSMHPNDEQKVFEKIVRANISAVIAPNMSAPIVMFMDMIDYLSKVYSGAFGGYSVKIVESHQATKKGTSATAISVGERLKRIGANFDEEIDIRKVRDTTEQLLMGDPPVNLDGHAYHDYALVSPDGDVVLKIGHNVNGRGTYVDGTLRAVDYLSSRLKCNKFGKIYSMADVINGQKMDRDKR